MIRWGRKLGRLCAADTAASGALFCEEKGGEAMRRHLNPWAERCWGRRAGGWCVPWVLRLGVKGKASRGRQQQHQGSKLCFRHRAPTWKPNRREAGCKPNPRRPVL